jgi:hypothetical protein
MKMSADEYNEILCELARTREQDAHPEKMAET